MKEKVVFAAYVFQAFLTFYLAIFFQYITKVTDEKSSNGFFDFVGVMPHVMGTSSVTYISLVFIPIAAMAFDVCWKVFSNMFYPTQTQIHMELEAKQLAEKQKSRKINKNTNQSNGTWRS